MSEGIATLPRPATVSSNSSAAVADIVGYIQGLVFAGAIDTVFEHPSLNVWPDDNPAYTANELAAQVGERHPTPNDVIAAINALAAHLAGTR
jgi:hypothetical protein